MFMRLFVVLIVILSSVVPQTAGSTPSDSLITLAWQAWNRNDQQTVEKCFTSALEADPHSARAQLGLSYLYALQARTEKAWDSFSAALSSLEEPYPYIFACWLTPQVLRHPHPEAAGVIALMERLASDKKAVPYLQAQAQEFLGTYYQSKGDLARSDGHFNAIKPVTSWTLIGPFENISASGFDKVFPPELEYNAGAKYKGKNEVPTNWFKPAALRRDLWVDLQRYFAFNQAVFYGHTFVYSPRKQLCQVRIGTSGSLKAFLNDDLLIAYPDENNNDLDTYIIQTELQKGWNSFLIKCGYSEIDACNFMVRITDTDGNPLEDLRYSTEPQEYPSHPQPQIKVIPNFAEQYLQRQIAQHPDWYEHYLLLADCYLRNDKAIEAELTLRAAAEKLPACAVFQTSLLEAYTRGEKNDEVSRTLERLFSLDRRIPTVLEYLIRRSLENEDYDAAEDYIKQLESLLPRSREVYAAWVGLYTKKKQLEKIVAVNAEGYKLYPDDWEIAYLQAAIDVQTTKKMDGAIHIVEDYLTRNYGWIPLKTLCDLYLQKGDLVKWKETCDRLLALEPVSPGYYYTMATGALERRSYADAEVWTRKALEFAPNASLYWTLLGGVLRSQARTDEAIDAFSRALLFYPAMYDAIEGLRDLQGKSPVFSSFPTPNIDSLIAHAPGAADYPGEPAVMLLDDTRRVVFPHGSSMLQRERLVKVFNSAGIDDQKEYVISYNSHSEGLLVERAVVVKKDGSEIKADVNNNSVVFKSLEPGDAIHLKWRIKNFYAGELAHHFWDTKNFSRFYPSRIVRYALLVPEGLRFDHRTLHMPDQPAVSTTPDGTLYQWTLTNEPSMEFEKGMPILDDAGKVLYVSSIGSWSYLVDWYDDLAKEKTRSTFEIKEQVHRLLSDKTNLTEAEKIEAIYNFITEEIRYSSVSFRQSGLIPQKARDVLATRIGDCKDMATLCIAMLREVGIPAYYVLVNTRNEGENRNAPPMLAFNHCIAAVETAQGTAFLDLTANDFPVGSVPKVDIGAFALLIKPGVTEPMYLPRSAFLLSSISARSDIALGKDNSATVIHDLSMTGIPAASVRSYYRHETEKEQLRRLSEQMNNHYPGGRVDDLSFRRLDSLTRELGMRFNCEVPSFALDAGKFRTVKNLWYFKFSPDEALAYTERKYPYKHDAPEDTLREDVTLRLPAGMKPLDLPADIHFTCPVADYSATYRFSKGLLRAKRQFVYKKDVIAPEEYAAFKQFYNNVVRDDSRQVLLQGK
jgi:tetratricopeptide (TPR) repeat protein